MQGSLKIVFKRVEKMIFYPFFLVQTKQQININHFKIVQKNGLNELYIVSIPKPMN